MLRCSTDRQRGGSGAAVGQQWGSVFELYLGFHAGKELSSVFDFLSHFPPPLFFSSSFNSHKFYFLLLIRLESWAPFKVWGN